MPSKAKVGSWLENGNGGPSGEAYESGSSSSGPSESGGSANDVVREEVPAVAVEAATKEVIEWETVLPKIKSALLDASRKRREDFVSHYLQITPQSPPPSLVPSIFTSLLSSLLLVTDPKTIDTVVGVIIALVARDEITDGEGKLRLGDKMVKWLSIEVEKASNPSRTVSATIFSPLLGLLIPLVSTLKAARKDFGSSPQLHELLYSLALILDTVFGSEGKSPRIERVLKGINLRVWRLLRELRDDIPSMLQALLSRSIAQPFRLSVLIGHVIGVALRLRTRGKRSEAEAKGGREMIEAKKDDITAFYLSNILGSKSAVPHHASAAFTEFLSEFVSFKLLSEQLLPSAEKMLLRSPEISLTLTADLLSSCPHDISALLPGKLVTAVLSASKSSNAETRSKAIVLMRAVIKRCGSETVLAKIATEILSLPKTGKTTSPEHRICLLNMTAILAPSDVVSSIVVDTLPPLYAKEGNETALLALSSALEAHLAHVLTSPTPVSSVASSALIKEMGSSKIPNRRAVLNAVGNAIWTIHSRSQFSPSGNEFIASLVPALEASLKAASANLPSNPLGFMEGYIAVALALGPLFSIMGSNPGLQGLTTVSPKPSFVLSEKAHVKLPSIEDDRWLLRSLEAIVLRNAEKLGHEAVRIAVGLALIHLVFDSKYTDIRREALQVVSKLSASHPKATSRIIRESLKSWLRTQDDLKLASKGKRVSEEDETVKTKSRDIGKLLSATLVPSPGTDVLEDIAVDFVVLAHHPEITEGSQVSWVSLIMGLGLDPATLALDKREKIIRLLWDAADTPPEDARLAEAAYHAITTLTFICPAIYVDVVLEKMEEDLDPAGIEWVGLEERGIWQTPPGETFVDVLTTKKDAADNKNVKDYATEKWEREVREALAKKKASSAGTVLSKQDKALVAAQLSKEAEVRLRIATQKAKLLRGLELIASLADSQAADVKKHVYTLGKLMLGSVFGPGSFLVDERSFEVFLKLASLASDRLGAYKPILAAAILRAFDAPHVRDDYTSEPTADLVTRILHQLHFAAEQTPLDSTTYALATMLMSRAVAVGGIGTESPQSEQAQEQFTLVVGIIQACCGEFQDDTYPRMQTIKDLLLIINNYSKLSKDAASALTDLGAAIKDVADAAEIQQLVAGTLAQESNVRGSALQALQPIDLTELDYSEEIWIATHDSDEQNATLALHLWEDNGLDIPETYLASLLKYLAHDSAAVRSSTARALSDAAEHYPSQVQPTVQGLEELYIEKAKTLQPEYDRFGMVIPESLNRADPFEVRVAIALGLEKLAPLLQDTYVAPIFGFLVTREALGDRHAEVRRAMLNAAISIVDIHGGKAVASLMKMFEDYLTSTAPSSETADYVKEAVVILFGRLARHLDASDERIPQVVDRLVEALNTPSELVQSAVADCLPPLVQSMSDEVEYLVDKLFSTLTTGAKYAGRRGAAYGLAGVVKGRGLSALKEYELMEKLQEAAEDKVAFQSRQGALFAFETLSATLGKVFEPYIISVIMSRISGHCVKLILPTLLGGLEEKQWRTKKGSIELLGAMAFCAPKQLSLSLPTIIPQLTGVINDSHAQVKAAANASLKKFGEVLSNPEIKSIQSTLMKALADPTAKTNNALAALLKTSFQHYLDAPSLALVMPIIDRGLKQRSSETKRKSAQIVGNMASLTEARDLVPYLHDLMPLVHEVLVDPVPEARATAAKSLGTLVERLGETNFPELVNDLLHTLRSDTSGVDRQGAAQGLSEVLSGLGMERLEGLLPEVIDNTASPRPYVREGFISLLVYLPATFGHRFAPHLGRIIPPILNGLADDSEYVREASMRAGKMIIANYSSKAIDLLLPELEKGMLDGAWRIRQSSISLTGELLYKVTGISGKVELEEDEVPVHGADSARKALLEALGPERRDRVLATLYIVRQDAVGVVRQASIHIWKALVQNTPRTTREILPILMQLLVSLLGSPQLDQQETASRTLGELCRKNGERIFGEIIPILRTAITSPNARTKEGACLAFAEVMESTSKDVLESYEDTIIAAIRTALVDSSASVRSAAAKTFDAMQQHMGAKAIDQTIPTLLEAMRHPGESSETALKALQEVMSVRAHTVFPVLIPTLIAQPITAFNARAIGALVRVAGSALNKRLDTVLGALVKSLEKEKSEEIREELNSAIEALLSSVEDSDGIHFLEMLLFGWAKDNNPQRRATACNVFGTMCQVNTADTSDYRVDWIRILISLFDDPVEEVVIASWEALDQMVKTIDKDDLEDLVVPLRRSIEAAGSPGRHVSGFSRPKGVQSIVPILLAGVLSGTQEQREQAAYGIGDLVQRTSEAAIKPYIIQLTGPLIRVISGQAIAAQIKVAILSTLTILLEEVPLLVRPFHPQLTRTFVKSASDPVALSVRTRAAAGLGALMKHQPRVDPLITELIGGIRAGDSDIAPSMATALAAVCNSAGKNIGPPAKASILELIEEAFTAGKGETYNSAVGKIVAGLAKNDPEDIREIVDTFLAAPTPPTALVSTIILAVLEVAPVAFYDLDVVEEIVKKILASVSAEQSSISRPAKESREAMKNVSRYEHDPLVQGLFRW
ncbi:hypothetical protein P7C73_g5471, partial [Tremellales sp. Uapishka_1]